MDQKHLNCIILPITETRMSRTIFKAIWLIGEPNLKMSTIKKLFWGAIIDTKVRDSKNHIIPKYP